LEEEKERSKELEERLTKPAENADESSEVNGLTIFLFFFRTYSHVYEK
jgi:hypothetical protein